MKIVDNIKYKDFEIRGYWPGIRPEGQEKLWNYRIYYKDQEVEPGYMAHTIDEAEAYIHKKVKAINAVLNAARKKYGSK